MTKVIRDGTVVGLDAQVGRASIKGETIAEIGPARMRARAGTRRVSAKRVILVGLNLG